MATHKLTDANIWIAQYDVTGDHNMVELPWGAEALDKTTFGQTTRIHQGGLYTAEIKGQGFVSYGTNEIEDILKTQLATADVPMSVCGVAATAGTRAYFIKALTADLQAMGGSVGDLHGFTFGAKANMALVPGTIMAAKSARTTSSNSGTALQLGAVSATQRIYAALHVFAASGSTPTLAVTVKSDDAVGFGSPTTQLTMTTASTATSEVKSAAGAITDTYWRVDWTISGSGPSFTFAVVIGII